LVRDLPLLAPQFKVALVVLVVVVLLTELAVLQLLLAELETRLQQALLREATVEALRLLQTTVRVVEVELLRLEPTQQQR
jgi:hypothetical protein